MGMGEELEQQAREASARRSRMAKKAGAWWGADVCVEDTDDGELLTVTYSPLAPMVLTIGYFAIFPVAVLVSSGVSGLGAVAGVISFVAGCAVLVYDLRWLWWRRWSVVATPKGHVGRRRGSGGVELDPDLTIVHGTKRAAGFRLGGLGLRKGGRKSDVAVYHYGFSPEHIAAATAFAERNNITRGAPSYEVPYGR